MLDEHGFDELVRDKDIAKGRAATTRRPLWGTYQFGT
jgi:hypothetical protein